MVLWIGGIALLLGISLLFLYIKVEICVNVREDESYKGVNFKIHSLFYQFTREFDYSDPRLRLLESLLISAFGKIKKTSRPAVTPQNQKNISFFRNYPLKYIALSALEDGQLMTFGLKYLQVENLEWKSVVGSKDAFRTALDTGICWAMKGAAIGVLSSRCKLDRLFLEVKPDFMKPAFNSTLTCILKMRTVHIILIEMFILAKKVRWCINGLRTRTGARAVQPSN
ncbi:MAG: DUF2953 domain-containing protein [Syntrophomonadaceae bacterium]|nr:DUF2953 domain-containing protein [Syntrophomonadaceae bacterium]